ncbi:MAG TPA: glycosyltransferase [Isosphaeraceae bacterium]|nr:glycosyltransferase [Isosphaeraceae bacterium]
MKLALSFANFGPYHLARLRALGERLAEAGGELLACETASTEAQYPWRPARGAEPFRTVTLFEGQVVEQIARSACAQATERELDRHQPDAVAVAGYVRPESLAAARWAIRNGKPAILMSESQEIDRPRVWWKEVAKRQRIKLFSAALVGGPRQRDYLVKLGMPANRIALGYNAVDNAWFASQSAQARREFRSWHNQPYFLTVSRFATEKNLPRLVRAFARYRQSAAADGRQAWDLVLCGAGPASGDVDSAIRASGVAEAIHRPGFLQSDALVRWYAFASAFVLPSLSEPWGLVVNEAAACGLPLLVSTRAGCVETLVPDPPGDTGWRIDPANEQGLTAHLSHMAALATPRRAAMGARAEEVANDWGPERFARGALEALAIASEIGQGRRMGRSTHSTAAVKGGSA